MGLAMGKNTNKPVRAPPPPARTDDDFEAKPFHSKQFEKEYLDSLVNAKARMIGPVSRPPCGAPRENSLHFPAVSSSIGS